jgi:hypothetical protein
MTKLLDQIPAPSLRLWIWLFVIAILAFGGLVMVDASHHKEMAEQHKLHTAQDQKP